MENLIRILESEIRQRESFATTPEHHKIIDELRDIKNRMDALCSKVKDQSYLGEYQYQQ